MISSGGKQKIILIISFFVLLCFHFSSSPALRCLASSCWKIPLLNSTRQLTSTRQPINYIPRTSSTTAPTCLCFPPRSGENTQCDNLRLKFFIKRPSLTDQDLQQTCAQISKNLLQCPQDLYLLRPASLQTPHPPVKIIYNMLIIKNKRYMKHFCSSVIYVNSTNQQRNLLPLSSHRENSKMNKIRFQSPPLPWQKEQISFFLLETFLLAAAHSPFPDTKSDIQEL